MRGGTEGEGIQQEAELLVRLGVGQTHDVEDPLLNLPAVNTDRAATDLIAVAHHVVGVGECATRVGVERVHELGLGRGERMVHGSPGTRADSHVTRGLRLAGRLEQWGVKNPEEGPLRLVDELTAFADLQPRRTQQGPRGLDRTCREKDAVAIVGAGVLGQTLALALGQVLGDRPAEHTVLADQDIGQALGSALFGELLPGVELLARLRGATRHDDCADIRCLEHAEGGVFEEHRAVGELLTESQVWLVRAKARHGVRIGHPQHRRGDLVADETPERGRNRLTELEDVVLLDEAHLDVELGELRLTVGAEVLIAITTSDLVVALHASDHEELFEQLWALRQGVPGSGLQASRHQEVTGAFGGRAGQRGRLDLDKVSVGKNGTRSLVYLAAQANCRSGAGAAKVKVSVLEPRLLADGDALVDLERQRRSWAQHLELGRHHFDLTGR